MEPFGGTTRRNHPAEPPGGTCWRTLAAAALLGVSIYAQPAPPQSQPTFRSAIQSVEVDLTVKDGNGNFVADLAREDFEVLEDGVPQQIDTLFLVTGPTGQAATAPTAPSSDAVAVSAGVPRVATDRRVFIFFFDNDHIWSPAALDRARRAMSDFIQAQFRPGDVAGIVSDGKMIGNRLTSDAAELKAFSQSVKPSSTQRAKMLEFREWPRIRDDQEALRIARNDQEAYQNALTRACNEQPDACRVAEQLIPGKASRLAQATRVSSEQTLRSSEALVNGLSRLPGLKVVVFFSDGFPVEDSAERLRDAVGRAGRSGVRFYTIDLRGLNRQPEMLDAPVADDPAGAPGRFDLQADATNSLAVDTGGIAFRNYNEFGKPLDAIARDTATYYVIGYRPNNQEFDGKYRKIAVRVTRAGVKIRARQGYAAIAASVPVPTAGSDSGFRQLVPPEGSDSRFRREVPPGGSSPVQEPMSGTSPKNQPAEPAGGTNRRNPLSAPASVRPDPRERVSALMQRDTTAARATPSGAASNALAQAGWAKYEKGDVEGARDDLNRAATPDARPWVFYALGQSEFALQHYDRAIDAWKTVRERVPEFEEVYFDLADAHLQRGELSDAVAVLREAAKRWPGDPEIFNALGVIFARRDALDDAVDAFKRAVALAPADPLGHFNLARAYHLRYVKSRHYVPALQRWIQNDDDRKNAMAEYNRYLEIGGPQEQSARDALRALNEIW